MIPRLVRVIPNMPEKGEKYHKICFNFYSTGIYSTECVSFHLKGGGNILDRKQSLVPTKLYEGLNGVVAFTVNG